MTVCGLELVKCDVIEKTNKQTNKQKNMIRKSTCLIFCEHCWCLREAK